MWSWHVRDPRFLILVPPAAGGQRKDEAERIEVHEATIRIAVYSATDLQLSMAVYKALVVT